LKPLTDPKKKKHNHPSTARVEKTLRKKLRRITKPQTGRKRAQHTNPHQKKKQQKTKKKKNPFLRKWEKRHK